MASDELKATVQKLSDRSRQAYANPYTSLDFPASVPVGQDWFTSPELISIAGTPDYESLEDVQKRTISFYDAINFFSLNIHGEKALLEGLARRLYDPNLKDLSPYLHHFLDEENKHMVYFGEFCTRYGGKVYRDRKVIFPRDYAAGEEDFLFFARVLIFEEIVDFFNRRMGSDERLNQVARQINQMHHDDESRHLVFGRKVVKELFEKFRTVWSPEILEGVRSAVSAHYSAVWREYYNPDAYGDAGLPDPYGIAERAFSGAEAPRALRQKASKASVDYLIGLGVLEKEPAL